MTSFCPASHSLFARYSPCPARPGYLSFANLTNTSLTGATITGVTWNNMVCLDGTNGSSSGTNPQSCIGHGGASENRSGSLKESRKRAVRLDEISGSARRAALPL